MQLTIYRANIRGDANVTLYPKKCVIANAEDFKKAIAYDHVCAKFKNFLPERLKIKQQ